MKRKDRSSSSTNDERKTKKTKKVSDLQEIQELSKLDFSSAEKLFSSLIAPTTSKTFFTEYWEKKPLLIKRDDASFYGPLFSKSDLENILKKEEIEFVNDVNVCRYEDGDKLYMNDDVGSKATWARVSKDVKERNATVQFHQPQRFKDVLWKLNAHLESVFGCLVGANVYITPPDSQGLAPHYDDVEVFILQLEGKKQWKLYKCPTELPQDYSADLEQDSIGEPTHEFELQPGDMVYFPRGTVHQAVTPKGDSHSTHITLSTYQQHTWGSLLSSVVSDAIDKAMEVDVEFRRGLPLNCFSYMGLAMQNDGITKSKQEDFNNQVKHLLACLTNHLDIHSSVDKVAADFTANRLPPIEQKEEAMKDDKGDGEKAPTVDSEIKLRYPDHVRISVGKRSEIPIGGLSAYESDSDDDEMSDEEGEESDEDEDMEESEEETKPKKSSKSKNKSDKKTKREKVKPKNKGDKELTGDDDDDEVDSSDEGSKSKKKKKITEKDKKTKEKKQSKKTESMDDDMAGGKEKKSKKKNKGKKEQKGSDSEEDDDDDESFELGDEDTEDSEDDEDSDEEDDGPWVFVSHSLNNDHSTHMMGPQQPSVIKFSLTYKDALLYLYRQRQDFVPAKSLPLETDDTIHLVTSLWSEGLITIKE